MTIKKKKKNDKVKREKGKHQGRVFFTLPVLN